MLNDKPFHNNDKLTELLKYEECRGRIIEKKKKDSLYRVVIKSEQKYILELPILLISNIDELEEANKNDIISILKLEEKYKILLKNKQKIESNKKQM